jgi:transposase-like protein
MRKSDVQCPRCGAAYRKIEVSSMKRAADEFRCLTCNWLLETFSGTNYVAFRLTVQPKKTLKNHD